MAITNNTAVYREGTTPNTRSVVSSKNRIFAPAFGNQGFVQIGVIASFAPTETKNVEQVRGIGYGDQIAELVPGHTEAMTMTVTRTALYLANLFQVLGYASGVDGVARSLKHHKFPFDIKHELVFSNLAENQGLPNTSTAVFSTGDTLPALITLFEGCWMTSWSWEFTADGAMVQENGDFIVTDITDGIHQGFEFMDTGLSGQNGEYLSSVLQTG